MDIWKIGVVMSEQIVKPYSSHVFILPFTIDKQASQEYGKENWIKLDEPANNPCFKTPYLLVTENIRQSEQYARYAYEKFLNQEVHEAVKDYTDNYLYRGPELYYQINCYRKVDDKYKENYKKKKKKEYEEGQEVEAYRLKLNYIMVRLVREKIQVADGERIEENAKTGFLIISADNYKYNDIEQIRNINQFGRRIYAPFFLKNPVYQESADDILLSSETKDPSGNKNIFDSIYSKEGEKIENGKVRVMTGIKNLFHSFFGENIILFEQGFRTNNTDKKLEINRILDDRMFVVSNYDLGQSSFNQLTWALKGLKHDVVYKSKQFRTHYTEIGAANLVFEEQKRLYSYIYIDNGSSTYQSPETIKSQLDKSVYDRWIDYGTLYAITQHSMMMISNGTGGNFLYTYFYTEYLEMILFVLTQRVRILSFSKEAGDSAKDTGNSKEILRLQRRYVIFKNQFLLPELSSQDQAIELYEMMQNNLYVNKQKEILDDQIQSLYEISQVEANNNREEQNDWLNIILFIIALIGVVISFNDFYESLKAVGKGIWCDILSKSSNGYTNLENWSGFIIFILYIQLIHLLLKKSGLTFSSIWKKLKNMIHNIKEREY